MRTLLALILLAPQGTSISFEEKTLATIPEGVVVKNAVFHNGKQVAFKCSGPGKMWVCVNNSKSPEYGQVDEPIRFSASGKVGYRAYINGQWSVVVGGAPSAGAYIVGPPVFSPDGSKYAYECSARQQQAFDSKAWTVFVGGAKTGDWLSSGVPVWSGDSSTVGHTVRIGKAGTAQRAFFSAHAVVVAGKEGPEFEEVGTPAFAPKSRSVAYRARNQQTWTMMVDGKPQAGFRQIGNPFWSSDGKTLAYRADDNGTWTMVINGSKTSTHKLVSDPIWSPDGKVVAYHAANDKGYYIVVGDKQSEVFSYVASPVFSADSSIVAYPAKNDSGRWMAVLGDKQHPADYDVVGTPVISPDGKRVLYTAQWKFRWMVALDNQKNETFDSVQPPTWSPDSTKYAHAGQKDGKWYMVVNYRREDGFDEIYTPPYWSADGKKVAFGARKGPDILWKVVPVQE